MTTTRYESSGAPTALPMRSSGTSLTRWAVFGGVMLCLLGIINVVHGITALEYDELLTNQYVYDNLTFWGWTFLIWGVLQLLAGGMTFARNAAGPMLGMVLATIGAVGWFFMIFAAPAPALVGMGLSIAIVAALATALPE